MKYLRIIFPVLFIHILHRWEYYWEDRTCFYWGYEDKPFKHKFLHRKCKKCGKIMHKDQLPNKQLMFGWEHWHNG